MMVSPAGNSRENALAPAAKAGHEVIHHAAGENHLVARQDPPVQVDRGPRVVVPT